MCIRDSDIRESLSFKVKKGLEFKGASVLWNDPYLEGSTNIDELDAACDCLVLCTPHSDYKNHTFRSQLVDIWGFFGMPELTILPGTREETKKVANS